MASERRWTEREADKVRRVIRSTESPPQPATAFGVRSRGIRRTGHHHNLEPRLASTNIAIASNASGSATVYDGPHPLSATSEIVTVYNYSADEIPANHIVKIDWMVATATGGFWLATPLCCADDGMASASCAALSVDFADPTPVAISGVTSTIGLTSDGPSILNRTHQLKPQSTLSPCVVWLNDALASYLLDSQSHAYKIELTAETSSLHCKVSHEAFSEDVDFRKAQVGPYDGTANHVLTATDSTMTGLDWSAATIEVNP